MSDRPRHAVGGDAAVERAERRDGRTPSATSWPSELAQRRRTATSARLPTSTTTASASAREIERRVEESRDALLREWLEAVDSVERALRMDARRPPARTGLRSVLDQMEAILARHGVERIGAAGEPFDPERHEAVEVRASDDVARPHGRRGRPLGLRDRRPRAAARAGVVVARGRSPTA